ncbi:MAG: RNA-binding protein [Candidatus Kerfeldbacteria bacterium CG15_BIG_FIL_POST_REV_8_21_14_020_45_12]|uniref:RNA-binding protein KhpA n=1 Tax=Candidatus Kerfeldbacteria bacterium CG15_BIG_FIL_POST_REV_8_21_14_020_45_12 TaxID=2014247 RepID=A0A2M7H493_9BACT|nr:MAG: RNA-binding protein [Candidatus Kerfeldbacteria bacterium CG15_BIG_FIL_POST_REV_8_21_14_020_45_12]PJA94038.1 MAG: RNA-binding protein [Candidatus Kerfeldbacteria bacterium CG_4_9_14_3_um_filter_45_8]
MEQFHDQEFVEYVVKSIVDNPDAVSTERTVDEMGVLITLTVDQNDLGQVIGRQGQTAKAIRTLLRVVGAKNQARVNLKIYEPDGGNRPPREHRDNREPRQEMREQPAAEEQAPAPNTSSAIDNLDL